MIDGVRRYPARSCSQKLLILLLIKIFGKIEMDKVSKDPENGTRGVTNTELEHILRKIAQSATQEDGTRWR